MKAQAISPVYFLFATLLLLEVLISGQMQMEIPRNGDITIHINAAQRILEGQQLYRDMITVNLPLQFYMRVPGVFVAQLLHVDPVTVAIIFDNLISLISAVLVIYILSNTVLRQYPSMLWCLAIVLTYTYTIFPINEMIMGQKEYFFFLFTLPYFTMTAAQTESPRFSRGFRIFIGAFSTLGFCYKPFCIIPLIMVEAYLCWQARSLKPLFKAELVTCVALGALYLLWFVLYFPQYFTDMVPLTTFYYHMRPDIPIILRFYVNRYLPFLIATMTLGAYNFYVKPPHGRFFIVLSLASIGYFLDAACQLKTFMHHLFPGYSSVFFLFTLASAFAWVERKSSADVITPRDKAFRAVTIIALSGMLIQSNFINPTPVNPDWGMAQYNHVMEVYRKYSNAPVTSFYKLGYRIAPMFPQGIYQGLQWDYHFYHLWPLAGIYSYRFRNQDKPDEWVDAKVAKAEDLLRTTIADDMERLKPPVLIVERISQVDCIKFFSVNPKFAEMMKYYELEDTYHGLDIYVRQDQPITEQEQKELDEAFKRKRRAMTQQEQFDQDEP